MNVRTYVKKSTKKTSRSKKTAKKITPWSGAPSVKEKPGRQRKRVEPVRKNRHSRASVAMKSQGAGAPDLRLMPYLTPRGSTELERDLRLVGPAVIETLDLDTGVDPRSPTEIYLDRVRGALQLRDTDQLSREVYVGLLIEIRSDLDGMIEAAVEEEREDNEQSEDETAVKGDGQETSKANFVIDWNANDGSGDPDE